MTFGLWNKCPDSVAVAWGARAIVAGRWPKVNIELLYDRQSSRGDGEGRRDFSARLNAGPLKLALARAARMFESCELDNKLSNCVELYGPSPERSDADIRILADTKASCGYLYIIAFPLVIPH